MRMMNCKGFRRRQSWPDLRYFPGIYLDGLRKTTKNLSQDILSPGRDLNPGLTEYESEVLTTRPLNSVSRVMSWPICSSFLSLFLIFNEKPSGGCNFFWFERSFFQWNGMKNGFIENVYVTLTATSISLLVHCPSKHWVFRLLTM
jgi:hypothetical protein